MRSALANLRWAIGLLGLRPRSLIAPVIYGVLGVGSAITLLGCSAWLIARAAQMPHIGAITLVVIAVRALGISRGVFRYIERLASHDVALRGVARLRGEIYGRLAAADMARVASLRRGDVLTAISKDTDALADVLVRGLLPFGVAIGAGSLSVAAVAVVSWPSAVALAAGLVVAVGCAPWLVTTSAWRATVDQAAARAAVDVEVVDLLTHRAELEVDGTWHTRRAAVDAAHASILASTRREAWWRALADALIVVGLAIAVVGAIAWGRDAVGGDGWSVVWYSVLVLLPLGVFDVATTLPAAALDVVRGADAATRLRARHPDADVKGVTEASGSELQPASIVGVRAHDLSAGWPEGPAGDPVHFGLGRGDVLLLKGPSGCGKTSLLLTLTGHLTPRAGAVELLTGTGVPIPVADVPDRTLRDLTALCPEDGHVFATTVRENLQLVGGPRNDDDLRGALAMVGLTDWLAGLPEGLESMLASGGDSMSGGERRRLLVARTLLSEAPVLVFDEPTEHLDAASAQRLAGRLAQWCADQGRVLVVATHDDAFDEHARVVVNLACTEHRP